MIRGETSGSDSINLNQNTSIHGTLQPFILQGAQQKTSFKTYLGG
jgi:hypothetical protein